MWWTCLSRGLTRGAVRHARELRSEEIDDVARWLSWAKIKKTEEKMRQQAHKITIVEL